MRPHHRSQPAPFRSTANPAVTFKYNPHQMSRLDVLSTFVGREVLLDHLLSHLRRSRAGGKHIFLYGPRGIGKTTLLLVLRYTLDEDPGLQEAFDVVQFSEEERRIVNLPSFAIRTLELLAQARGSRPDDLVRAHLEAAQKKPERAFDFLLLAGEQLRGRQVLFLVDNFDDLTVAVVSGKGRRFGASTDELVGQLDRFLACPAFQVVATALQSPEKRREFPSVLLDRFETPILVEPLTDAMELLRRRAVRDTRGGFLEHLPRLASRIDGLNRLADGNPRLLVFLYECLGDRHVPDLVEIVQRTIDGLTPMYQDVLDRLLNRGQAAVLEMLASQGGVGRAKEIAELTYQDEQTVRTFLGDLCNLGLVVRSESLRLPGHEPTDRSRETIFRTYPTLFQIWYEMRHLQQQEGLYLVHFFSLLTEADEARRMLGEGVDAPIEVRQLFEKVVDVLDPVWEDLRKKHVDAALARRGTLRDAVESLDRALESVREKLDRVGLLAVRSDVLESLGDFQGAEADLKAAEEILREAGSSEQKIKLLIARSGLLVSIGETRQGLELAEAALTESTGLTGAGAEDLRAYGLLTWAQCLFVLGEIRRALASADLASAKLNEKSSPTLRGALASLRGVLLKNLGRIEEARSYFEEALRFAQERGSLLVEAQVQRNLGNIHRLLGDSRQAEEHFVRSLDIARKASLSSGEADTLSVLGLLRQSQGDFEEAAECFEQALAIYRRLGSRLGILEALGNLGGLYHARGDSGRAQVTWEEGLVVSRELGRRRDEAGLLVNLGILSSDGGEPERARELYEKSLPIFRETGDRLSEATVLNNLGNIWLSAREFQRAEDSLTGSLQIFRETGNRAGEAMALANLGRCLFGQARYADARQHLESAAAITESGDLSAHAKVLANLGLVAKAEGRTEEFLFHLRSACAIFLKLGMTADRRKSAIQMTSALLQMAAESLGKSEPLRAETCFGQALEVFDSSDAEAFVAAFIDKLVVPSLRHSRDLAAPLLVYTKRLMSHTASDEETSAPLRTLEPVLRYFMADRSVAELKDLGPTEIFLVRLLIDAIERPAHAAALNLIASGEFVEARKVLEGILDRSPDDVEALFNLGSVLLRQGDLEEAKSRLSRVLILRPGMTGLRLLAEKVEAALLRRQKRFAELADALRRWRALTKSPEAENLDILIAEAELLAGRPDRSRSALPPDGFIPEAAGGRILLGLLRILFALRSGDAEAVRRQSGDLLRFTAALPPGKVPDPVTPELLERAREILGEREVHLFTSLVPAVRQQAEPEQLAAELLGDQDRGELRQRLAEEGRLALEALRNGRIHGLSDLFRLSTRSLGPRAGLAALGDAYAGLEPGQRRVVLDILAEAPVQGDPAEALTALGALGKVFAHLNPGDRRRSLDAILGLAERDEAEPAVQERALSLLNVLYPNLASSERRDLTGRLDALRARRQSPALLEMFRDTIPAVERNSAQ